MSNISIVVDMQNDFVTGSLANPMAEAIIPNIQREIESRKYNYICYTMDTHQDNYLETSEGKALPVEHCIKGTQGWAICDLLQYRTANKSYFEKPTFGSIGLLGSFDKVYTTNSYKDWDLIFPEHVESGRLVVNKVI